MELTISQIESKILLIRSTQVMLDSDLAALYQTETKYINRAVKRNLSRFPDAFAFQLNDEEWERLRCQFGTLNDKPGRGQHRKYLPYVFTEQGVAMLSAVLRSGLPSRAWIRSPLAYCQNWALFPDLPPAHQLLQQVVFKCKLAIRVARILQLPLAAFNSYGMNPLATGLFPLMAHGAAHKQ